MNIIFLTGLSSSGKTTIAKVISEQLNASTISLRQDVLHPLAVKHGLERGRFWVMSTIYNPKLLVKERKELLRLIKERRQSKYLVIDDLIDPGTPGYLRKQLKGDKIVVISVKAKVNLRKRWIVKRIGFPINKAIKELKFLDLLKLKAGIGKTIKNADLEVENDGKLEDTVKSLRIKLENFLKNL